MSPATGAAYLKALMSVALSVMPAPLSGVTALHIGGAPPTPPPPVPAIGALPAVVPAPPPPTTPAPPTGPPELPPVPAPPLPADPPVWAFVPAPPGVGVPPVVVHAAAAATTPPARPRRPRSRIELLFREDIRGKSPKWRVYKANVKSRKR